MIAVPCLLMHHRAWDHNHAFIKHNSIKQLGRHGKLQGLLAHFKQPGVLAQRLIMRSAPIHHQGRAIPGELHQCHPVAGPATRPFHTLLASSPLRPCAIASSTAA